jgi:cell wall-associated NlpC family hydrolase
MNYNRQQFIDDARALAKQGVIFRHQGSDPATGLDCINLPKYLYEKQGLKLPAELAREFESYSEQPDGWNLLEIMRKWFPEIESSSAGDLLIIYARRNPKHLAIQVTDDEPPMIVEAYRSESQKIGAIIDHPLDFRRRIAARFRFPDFA